MSQPQATRVGVIGGGAAGFFAAIAAARKGAQVALFESGSRFLQKVRISGGGRCNVTHHCFDPIEFSTRYPRGRRALIGAFHRFQAEDTVAWFKECGVDLKTEPDGRMFPVTNTSDTIVECLLEQAIGAGVALHTDCGVESIACLPNGGFRLEFARRASQEFDRICMAPGGCRSGQIRNLVRGLGHGLVEPVPSLFTFHVDCDWLNALPGLSVPDAEVSVDGSSLRERGPVLVTHTGLSGPAILRLSAWGARELHGLNYQFTLRLRWAGDWTEERAMTAMTEQRSHHPSKAVTNTPLAELPTRLWKQLVHNTGVPDAMRWTNLPRAQAKSLAAAMANTRLSVKGKSLNKEEFVTCGGVPLSEVAFQTMQSKIHPGLFFAGEILDIDGITGGFNFQSAWTTGWIAGNNMVL